MMSYENKVEATVKWYDEVREFGFLVSPEINRDIFVHKSVVHNARLIKLVPGDVVICDIVPSEKGVQATRIVGIKLNYSEWDIPVFLQDKKVSAYNNEVYEITGTIKWYNPFKMFGFIHADDGGPEIFIHASALKMSGFDHIERDTPVSVIYIMTKSGREAKEISIIN